MVRFGEGFAERTLSCLLILGCSDESVPIFMRSELMLLGLIGLLIFMANRTSLTRVLSERMAEWGTSDGNGGRVLQCQPSQIVELFEKVHLGICATIAIYLLTCIWLILLHWIIYKHWIRVDDKPFNLLVYRSLLSDHHRTHFLLRYLHIPRLLKLSRLRSIDRIQALRRACIEQFGLPVSFPFSIYLKFAMRDVVIRVLEVHPIWWAVLILAFGFTFVRISVLRVDNSNITIIIYAALSFAFTLMTALVLYLADRIYKKVLTLASVRRHLTIQGHDEHILQTDDDSEHQLLGRERMNSSDSENTAHGHSQKIGGNRYEATERSSLLAGSVDNDYSTRKKVTNRSLDQEGEVSAGSEREDGSEPEAKDERDSETISFRMDSETYSDVGSGDGVHAMSINSPKEYGSIGEESDTDVRSFEDLQPETRLKFDVFNRHYAGDTMTMMSVAEYREMSRMVTFMFRRAQMQTKDDVEHKGMLFFRNRHYLVFALQFITFFQSWILGLAIYYSWSIYNDPPRAPLASSTLFILLSMGPILTYALMGLVLAKLVKSIYTGGLVRPDLLLETMFQPDRSSDAHSSAQFSDSVPVSQMESWRRMTYSRKAPIYAEDGRY